MTEWEIVPSLAAAFGLSRSATRRDLAGGGFYLRRESAWQQLADDDTLQADGFPALALFRHGKRDVRLVEFVP